MHCTAEQNSQCIEVQSIMELRETPIALLTTFQACNIASCALIVLIAGEWVTKLNSTDSICQPVHNKCNLNPNHNSVQMLLIHLQYIDLLISNFNWSARTPYQLFGWSIYLISLSKRN